MKVSQLSIIMVCAAMLPLHALKLHLPTPNRGLLDGGPDFYMYVDRNFQGKKSTPWQGGQYGFVRGPVMVGGRKLYRRFHEGIDIKPVRRGAAGEPLDPILAAADGIVRYANRGASLSNYGRYVVIEHKWGDSPVFSLYAHLAEVGVDAGQRVAGGEQIGRMGYTGRGLDRRRAHLHFEIGLMYNSNFDGWHQTYFAGSPNHHSIYNGLNLFSMNPVDLYAAKRDNPQLSMAEFMRSRQSYFRVRLPNSRHLQVINRYPWLMGSHTDQQARSWEFSFTASGMVVSAEPSDIATEEPKLVSIKNSRVPYRYVTRGLINGAQGSASLSKTGLRTMHLLLFPDG